MPPTLLLQTPACVLMPKWNKMETAILLLRNHNGLTRASSKRPRVEHPSTNLNLLHIICSTSRFIATSHRSENTRAGESAKQNRQQPHKGSARFAPEPATMIPQSWNKSQHPIPQCLPSSNELDNRRLHSSKFSPWSMMPWRNAAGDQWIFPKWPLMPNCRIAVLCDRMWRSCQLSPKPLNGLCLILT